MSTQINKSMKRCSVRNAIVSLVLGVLLVVAGPAQAEKKITLKFATFFPPSHRVVKELLIPWMKEVEKRSGGKVAFRFYAAGSTYGNIFKQYDQVVAGVVDVSVGLQGIPRGRFPRTSIIELPFMVQSADASSRALWDVFPKYLKAEYPKVKVLALFAHNAGLIHTAKKQVRTLDDLKGLRIRTPGPVISAMLQHLGATPVGMPPGRVYESIEKGTIDGTVFPWDPLNAFKLYEVINYSFDARIYVTPFYFVMNERRYRSLAPDIRKAIDQASGATLVAKIGGIWNRADAVGKKLAMSRNNKITRIGPAVRAAMQKRLAPMAKVYLAKLKAKNGVANAEEIYNAMRAAVAKYEKR
ncbi:MAG: TRAP transporter substrate-binding protein [Alphaproteobacteria bacterium]